MRNETFGRLLKAAIGSIVAHEGKTAPVVEEELGNFMGVSGASIQRYKAGHIPPESRSIEILATAGVQRGYLNQTWLKAFLRTSGYTAQEQLIKKLFGVIFTPEQHHANKPVYSNLPAPTYTRFIPREAAYNAVIEGLGQRCAAVVLISLGGMGKTSLAREIAAHCLEPEAIIYFQAVIWVSDYDRPGTTTLETVLNEIAFTLDYPGLVYLDSQTRQREVDRLLRHQRVLLVLDNCETITDIALLDWLVRIPEPSKALITSRENFSQFRRSGWLVELEGMTRSEAHEFLRARAQALKLNRLITDLSQFEPVLQVTGGNPKALDLSLGYLKFSGQTLEQIMRSIEAAQGEIFDDLFSQSWEMLDEAARQMLLAMPLFYSSVAGPALLHTAGVAGSQFASLVNRLRELALVETQQPDINTPPRYALHPLVRAFVGGKLDRQPNFAQAARQRQVEWYIELAEKVGYCWDDLGRLNLLDPEKETIHALVKWCLEQKRYDWLFRLACGVDYYYYIRGLWQDEPGISELRVIAAQQLDDRVETVKALAYHIQMLCRRDRLEEAQKYLEQLRTSTQDLFLPEAVNFDLEYTTGLYLLSCEEYEQANSTWQKAVTLAANLSVRDYAVSRGWLALCFYRCGQRDEAARLWQAILQDAAEGGFERGIVSSHLGLARIHLDQTKYEQTLEHLAAAQELASSYQDRSAAAEIEYLYTLYYRQTDNKPLARRHCLEALDLFKRLGRPKEYAEVAQLLSEIETI